MSDNPANPFQTITPLKMQYTDCGAHTITAWTGFAEDATNPRLIVYVASYPLRAGPTCGQANFNNVANPYDEDKVVNDPLHRQIQVLSVPLNNPAATTEIAAPRISYPGDPDGQDRLDRARTSPGSSRRRSRATTSWCTWSTTWPVARAPSRARCGRSTRAPGSRIPRTR